MSKDEDVASCRIVSAQNVDIFWHITDKHVTVTTDRLGGGGKEGILSTQCTIEINLHKIIHKNKQLKIQFYVMAGNLIIL